VQGAASLPVPRRLTFTFPLINQARSVLVLAEGAAKRPIVEAVMRSGPDAEQYPVSRVKPAGHLTWLVDEDAGG
jgi:6-phosphogluconolactonase